MTTCKPSDPRILTFPIQADTQPELLTRLVSSLELLYEVGIRPRGIRVVETTEEIGLPKIIPDIDTSRA